MAGEPSRYTFDRVVRLVLSALVLVGVFLLVNHLSTVLLPFAAAAVLAYLLNPMVSALEKRTHRRGLAVVLTIGGLGIVGVAMIAIIVPLMASQVGRFQTNLQDLGTDFSASIQSSATLDKLPVQEDETSEPTEDAEKTALGFRELRVGWGVFRSDLSKPRSERFALLYQHVSGTYVGDAIAGLRRYSKSDEFSKLMVEMAKNLALGGWTVVSFALNFVLGLTGLIVVALYLIFLLLDYPEYARTWQTFLPPDYRETIVDFLEQFDLVMRRYLRAQVVVASIVGILMSIGFTIIGLPMAIPFGLFIGLLNMVPYLQTVAILPAVMLAGLRAIDGSSGFVVSVVLALSVMAIVQVIQDVLITPRIVGKSTGLRPLAILLGVCVWGKLLGFLGLVLAIPLTCLWIAYYRRYILLNANAKTAASEAGIADE